MGQNVGLYAAIVDPVGLGVSVGQSGALFAGNLDSTVLGVSVGQKVGLYAGIVDPSVRVVSGVRTWFYTLRPLLTLQVWGSAWVRK